MNNSHDEIKKLLKASRNLLSSNESLNETFEIKKRYGMILENSVTDLTSQNVTKKIDTGKSIEKNITDDENNEKRDEEIAEYRVSGGIIVLHGKNKKELVLTEDEKLAFQETMDEFVEEVSNMVDFNPLHIYEKNVIWSGLLRKQNLTFIFNLNDGVYFEIETMIKLDMELLETQKKLERYFTKFESKWADIIGNRIKTKVSNERPTEKQEYETFKQSTKPIGL
jgi:hypothetical protein